MYTGLRSPPAISRAPVWAHCTATGGCGPRRTWPCHAAVRDRRGVRYPDHRRRLGCREHPQGDAQVGVGKDVVVDRTGRPLRREHQVDAEAAAALGDVDDAGDELGDLLGERGELVDDDHQRRWCQVRRVVTQLVQIAGASVEQAHPVIELGAQRDECPAGELGRQVADTPDGVRQRCERCCRGTALVVHEQERQQCRRMARRARRPTPAAVRSCRSRTCRRSARGGRRQRGRRRPGQRGRRRSGPTARHLCGVASCRPPIRHSARRRRARRAARRGARSRPWASRSTRRAAGPACAPDDRLSTDAAARERIVAANRRRPTRASRRCRRRRCCCHRRSRRRCRRAARRAGRSPSHGAGSSPRVRRAAARSTRRCRRVRAAARPVPAPRQCASRAPPGTAASTRCPTRRRQHRRTCPRDAYAPTR